MEALTSRWIKTYPNMASPSDCEYIIEYFERSGSVINGMTGGGYYPHKKSCTELYFPPYEHLETPEQIRIDSIISTAARQALKQYITEIPSGKLSGISGGLKMEEFKIKKYDNNGSDQYDWHIDTSTASTGSRFLVILLYLNTVKEGGRTLYQHWPGSHVTPVQGTVAIAPTSFEYLHAGEKPVSNSKYIANLFVHLPTNEDEL